MRFHLGGLKPDGTSGEARLDANERLQTAGATAVGDNAALGTTSDAAWSGSGAGTVVALLKAIRARIPGVGQNSMSQSLPVVIANDQTSVPVGGRLLSASTEFTRPNDATPYTAGDVVSDSTSAPTVQVLTGIGRVNGGSGYVVAARLTTDKKSITPRLRVHLFNAVNPTVSVDNAAFRDVYADTGKRLGYFDMPAMLTGTDTTNSDESRSVALSCRIPFLCAGGSPNLWYVLETLDAFTPAALEKITLSVLADVN